MERVRAGVIGLGWPGQRHIEGYLKQPDVDLIALCDANEALLAESQRTHQIPHAFTDYEEMLAFDGLDVVSVCLPNFLHAPVSIAALERGKHVLCEKPLARTVEEGRQIAAAVERSGLVFMMALNNRFRPDTLALKAHIERGGLGDIYYAKAGWLRREWNPLVRGWFTRRAQSGGGPLIDLGVHMLDLALWCMGNPRPVAVSGATYQPFRERVAAEIGEIDTEDLATGLVRLADGRVVIVEASWISFTEYPDYIYCSLFGTEAGALVERFTGQSRLKIFSEPVKGLPLTGSPLPVTDTMSMTHASFANEIGHFVECVRTGREPSASVQQGLDVLCILDALYRSAQSGGEARIDW